MSISNFRSIEDSVSIAIPSRHVAFVGGNNAGKSNIIAAVDWVLGSRAPYQLRPERDDFFTTSKPIVLEAVLGDIGATDKPELMTLTTNQKQRGALSKAASPEIILTLTVPPEEGAPVEAEEDEAEDPLPSRTTLAVSLWGFPVYKKTVELRQALVQLVHVSSHRTVEDDLTASKWTPYGQLMKAVLEASPEYKDLKNLLVQVNSKIQQAFTNQKSALLTDARVVSYVDDIAFQLTRENEPTELLRYLEILVSEGKRQVNISRVGTGTQSAVIIGMLELVLRSKGSRVKLFAVEEPEAYIHPHGVRHLAGLVRRVGEDHGSQVLLTTHSPSLLATLSPADIVRVEKKSGQTVVFQSPGTLKDPVFARFVNQDTAEMFFAQRVVLVEGATERFLLPPLSRLLEVDGQSLDFDRLQISVVELSGKRSVVNFLRILDEFKIRTVAILDKDFLGDSSCKSLIKYLKSTGRMVDDSDDDSKHRDLLSHGVVVLSKGEIENYIPDADVAAASGVPLANVQSALTGAKKASDAFKNIFGMGKPVYALQIAEYYATKGVVPDEVSRLVRLVACDRTKSMPTEAL